MEKRKAKKIHTYYGTYSNVVEYEYRGNTYDVEYATSETYLCTPAWYQHKIEQEKIDKILDAPPVDHSEQSTVQEALDYFFDYINGDANNN